MMTPTSHATRLRHEGSRPREAEAPPLDVSERRVVRQLVEALLFEGLVAYETKPRSPRAGALDAFEAVYDARIDFVVGRHSYRCFGRKGAFGRIRIADGSITSASGDEEARLPDLVASLPIDERHRARLLGELTQTLAICRVDHDHLTHQHTPRRHLDFQALESAIVEGHPYHPCFKTRTGFSLRDHADYGSEAGRAFRLEWLAVARDTLRSALPSDEATFWKHELGDAVYDALRERLASEVTDTGAYALLPVHPWQLDAIRSIGLDDALGSRTIVRLGAAGDHYRATQSLRTLVNVSRPEKANVKLPLDIVCTSTHRNFETHFVCTAPLLSRWLAAFVEADPFLAKSGHLVLLSEYAGILHEPTPRGTARDAYGFEGLEGRLGVIYRESVCRKLAIGESAVPFTALTVVESDGRPFVADWVHTHGVARWVDRLIEVMLIPIWHVLVHHGVAFEAHAQNLILIHRDGWPEKIVIRDFHQDTEFVPDFLRAPGDVPDFAAIDPYFATVPDDDGYRMGAVEDLRELFMDTVYVYNLADVSFLMERFFGFSETRFWQIVRHRLRAYEEAGVTEKHRIDRLGCDSAEIAVESLLTKKLMNGAVLDFFAHRIPNPLCG